MIFVDNNKFRYLFLCIFVQDIANNFLDKSMDLWYDIKVAPFDPLAQTVEHLTFNQGVRSSSLRRVTTKRARIFQKFLLFFFFCDILNSEIYKEVTQ